MEVKGNVCLVEGGEGDCLRAITRLNSAIEFLWVAKHEETYSIIGIIG